MLWFYLVQVQRQQQQDQQVTHSHAAQVQVGGASHVWAEPNHQNSQNVSQKAKQHQWNVNHRHTHYRRERFLRFLDF